MRFQKRHQIEVETSSDDSDNDPMLDPVKLIENKNPLIRMGALIRLKKMLETYKNENLDPFDTRLIKGIFYRSNKDFDEE